MLWDLIRDFFVQNIFGGIDSTNTLYMCKVGAIMDAQGTLEQNCNNTDLYVKLGNVCVDGGQLTTYGYDTYISFGDWLSTTATAISITIIVVLCCLFVYKIIKLIGGLIR